MPVRSRLKSWGRCVWAILVSPRLSSAIELTRSQSVRNWIVRTKSQFSLIETEDLCVIWSCLACTPSSIGCPAPDLTGFAFRFTAPSNHFVYPILLRTLDIHVSAGSVGRHRVWGHLSFFSFLNHHSLNYTRKVGMQQFEARCKSGAAGQYVLFSSKWCGGRSAQILLQPKVRKLLKTAHSLTAKPLPKHQISFLYLFD